MKMLLNNIHIIVSGSLNTDLIGLGVKEILGTGELTFGGRLVVGPGGKSRNIAQMISVLFGNGKVAMIGRTSKDPFNLWKLPVDALLKSGVSTDFIKVVNFKETGKYPGIALIPVTEKGENQIYVLPGVNEDFCPADIDEAEKLFLAAKKNTGIFTLSLELPIETAVYALEKAGFYGLKVVFDPGGISKKSDYTKLFKQKIFFIKPNEHEAEILTGVKVTDFYSAKAAANHFFEKDIENVLITHGKNGGYLFVKNKKEYHIKIPLLEISGPCDETGCGDQVTAVLCAGLISGKNIVEMSKDAILAGTIQFHKTGIIPVTLSELNQYGNNMRQ